MQLKQALPLALATAVSAQNPSFADAVAAQGDLSALAGLLNSTGLATTLAGLTNVTLLAPNNAAIGALLNSTAASSTLADQSALAALLYYHVLNGTLYADSFTNTSQFHPTYLTQEDFANVEGGQRVESRLSDSNVTFFSAFKENSTVVTPNLNFTGGVIHIIDTVLTLPVNVSDTLSAANLTAASGAIRTANVEGNLAGLRDVTIFAPDNDAFNAIGSVLANLTVEDLSNVVGYHVIENTVAYSSDLTNMTVTAQNGDDLTITVINGTVYVNAARVTVPDLLVSNGVVHVINQVLNSGNSTGTPDTSATSAAPAFSGASSGTAGIPYTSGVPTPTSTVPAATSGGTAATSTSNPGMPMKTAAVGVAALFGGAAAFVNF